MITTIKAWKAQKINENSSNNEELFDELEELLSSGENKEATEIFDNLSDEAKEAYIDYRHDNFTDFSNLSNWIDGVAPTRDEVKTDLLYLIDLGRNIKDTTNLDYSNTEANIGSFITDINEFEKIKNTKNYDELYYYLLSNMDSKVFVTFLPEGGSLQGFAKFLIANSNESSVNENNGSFTKLRFNSNTWHNSECDILEGHLDADSFITYGIYIKDSASGKRKAGDEFMEYYKGSNYVVGSKARPHSRVFGAENIPAKYKAKWNELKAIYEEKYKGKEHVKESTNVEEAYTFDFEEFMDTDLSGPAVEMSINNLIDEFIDIVNNEIDKEGAGTGANLDAVKKQAYRAIAELWKRNIDEYLLKGIKFNA